MAVVYWVYSVKNHTLFCSSMRANMVYHLSLFCRISSLSEGSFAKEPCKRDLEPTWYTIWVSFVENRLFYRALLQKRPVIWRILFRSVYWVKNHILFCSSMWPYTWWLSYLYAHYFYSYLNGSYTCMAIIFTHITTYSPLTHNITYTRTRVTHNVTHIIMWL